MLECAAGVSDRDSNASRARRTFGLKRLQHQRAVSWLAAACANPLPHISPYIEIISSLSPNELVQCFVRRGNLRCGLFREFLDGTSEAQRRDLLCNGLRTTLPYHTGANPGLYLKEIPEVVFRAFGDVPESLKGRRLFSGRGKPREVALEWGWLPHLHTAIPLEAFSDQFNFPAMLRIIIDNKKAVHVSSKRVETGETDRLLSKDEVTLPLFSCGRLPWGQGTYCTEGGDRLKSIHFENRAGEIYQGNLTAGGFSDSIFFADDDESVRIASIVIKDGKNEKTVAMCSHLHSDSLIDVGRKNGPFWVKNLTVERNGTGRRGVVFVGEQRKTGPHTVGLFAVLPLAEVGQPFEAMFNSEGNPLWAKVGQSPGFYTPHVEFWNREFEFVRPFDSGFQWIGKNIVADACALAESRDELVAYTHINVLYDEASDKEAYRVSITDRLINIPFSLTSIPLEEGVEAVVIFDTKESGARPVQVWLGRYEPKEPLNCERPTFIPLQKFKLLEQDAFAFQAEKLIEEPPIELRPAVYVHVRNAIFGPDNAVHLPRRLLERENIVVPSIHATSEDRIIRSIEIKDHSTEKEITVSPLYYRNRMVIGCHVTRPDSSYRRYRMKALYAGEQLFMASWLAPSLRLDLNALPEGDLRLESQFDSQSVIQFGSFEHRLPAEFSYCPLITWLERGTNPPRVRKFEVVDPAFDAQAELVDIDRSHKVTLIPRYEDTIITGFKDEAGVDVIRLACMRGPGDRVVKAYYSTGKALAAAAKTNFTGSIDGFERRDLYADGRLIPEEEFPGELLKVAFDSGQPSSIVSYDFKNGELVDRASTRVSTVSAGAPKIAYEADSNLPEEAIRYLRYTKLLRRFPYTDEERGEAVRRVFTERELEKIYNVLVESHVYRKENPLNRKGRSKNNTETSQNGGSRDSTSRPEPIKASEQRVAGEVHSDRPKAQQDFPEALSPGTQQDRILELCKAFIDSKGEVPLQPLADTIEKYPYDISFMILLPPLSDRDTPTDPRVKALRQSPRFGALVYCLRSRLQKNLVDEAKGIVGDTRKPDRDLNDQALDKALILSIVLPGEFSKAIKPITDGLPRTRAIEALSNTLARGRTYSYACNDGLLYKLIQGINEQSDYFLDSSNLQVKPLLDEFRLLLKRYPEDSRTGFIRLLQLRRAQPITIQFMKKAVKDLNAAWGEHSLAPLLNM